MKTVSFFAGCAAAVMLTVFTPVHPAFGQAKGGQKGGAAAPAGPYKLEQLIGDIEVMHRNLVRQRVAQRGLDFAVGPEEARRIRAAIKANLATFDIKDAKVEEELFQFVVSKAKARVTPPAPVATSPPKPAAPKLAGKLSLFCSPAECEVTISGRPHGKTSGGKLEVEKLAAQRYVVDFLREGYESRQIAVNLVAGTPESQSVVLVPTLETQARQGADAFTRMVAKLGNEAGLADASQLVLTGTLNSFRPDKRTDWSVKVNLKLPSSALIEATAGGATWKASRVGNQSDGKGAGRLKGSPEAADLGKIVQDLRDYMPASIVRKVQSEQMKLVVPPPAPGTEARVLKATAGSETLTIHLNADDTASRVVYESASGLGSGFEVLFDDYTPVKSGLVPQAVTLKFPGREQHGAQFKFAQIRPNTQFRDRDFKP